AELVAVVAGSASPRAHVAAARPRPNLLSFSELYLYLDYRLFRPTVDAIDRVDIATRLSARNVIATTPLFDGTGFSFNEFDRRRLQELDLDVLLLFASGL